MTAIPDGSHDFQGGITLIEPTGAETHINLRVAGQTLTAALRDRAAYAIGQTLNLRIDTGNAHVFSKETGARLT